MSLSTTDPSSSLRDRKKRRSRDQIYEAAIDLFTERPYGEVTVEEICRRAEVGRATFFRFYGSKAGLLREFNDRIGERLMERIDAVPRYPAIDRLWAVCDEISTAWGASSAATREMAREWIRTSTGAELTEGGRTPELVALVAEVVRDGQASGEFTDRFQSDLIAFLVVSALQTTVANWLGSDDQDLASVNLNVMEFLLDGFRRAEP